MSVSLPSQAPDSYLDDISRAAPEVDAVPGRIPLHTNQLSLQFAEADVGGGQLAAVDSPALEEVLAPGQEGVRSHEGDDSARPALSITHPVGTDRPPVGDTPHNEALIVLTSERYQPAVIL